MTVARLVARRQVELKLVEVDDGAWDGSVHCVNCTGGGVTWATFGCKPSLPELMGSLMEDLVEHLEQTHAET